LLQTWNSFSYKKCALEEISEFMQISAQILLMFIDNVPCMSIRFFCQGRVNMDELLEKKRKEIRKKVRSTWPPGAGEQRHVLARVLVLSSLSEIPKSRCCIRREPSQTLNVSKSEPRPKVFLVVASEKLRRRVYFTTGRASNQTEFRVRLEANFPECALVLAKLWDLVDYVATFLIVTPVCTGVLNFKDIFLR